MREFMMSVKEYATDTNCSIAEILKKCEELGIDVRSGEDELSEDDIIMLDNTINLISTDNETDYEEEDARKNVCSSVGGDFSDYSKCPREQHRNIPYMGNDTSYGVELMGLLL